MEEVYKQMRRYETPNPPVHHLKGSLKTLQYLMNKLLHQKKAGSKHRYRYPDLSMIEDDPLKLAEISMRDKQQLMEEAELDLFRTHVSKIIENIYHKLSKLSKEDSITKSTKKIFQDTAGESASKKASNVSQDKSETEKASKDFIKTTLKASKAAKRKLVIEPSQKDFDISEKIAKISGVIEEESRTKTETKTPKATNEKSGTKKDLKVKTVPGTFEDIKERPRKSANTRPTFFPLRTETKDYILLPESENDKKKLDLRSGKEFVLTLRIYLPFHYKRPSYKQTRMSKFQNEIQVLGSTTLLELREVLFCIEDFRSLDGDVSENPLEPSGRRYKDRYPSSMFFINNTFYVDYSKNVDYSIVVKEWAKTQNIPLNFKTEDMGKTRIIDLQIKFNYMYLFQHLGECEHLIEFIENKLIDGGRHSLCSTDYPKFTKMLKYQGHLCLLCNKAFPSWMVVGYSRLPNKYSLLCKVCFKSYCYIDDKKIGSFKAYHHIDSRALVTY